MVTLNRLPTGYTPASMYSDSWLKANGFDGLCNTLCGCEVGDLRPGTDCDQKDCHPAYKTKCNPRTCTEGGECSWHMVDARNHP